MRIRKESLLNPDYLNHDYIDSYEYVIIDFDDKISVHDIAETFVKPGPEWFEGLFKIRNMIVSVFKLKNHAAIKENIGVNRKWDPGVQAGIFTVFDKSENEIILGEDDKHLKLRISLMLEKNGCNEREKRITVTTIVKVNNRLGRYYFFIIKPIHRTIVPFLLKQKFGQLETDANVLDI